RRKDAAEIMGFDMFGADGFVFALNPMFCGMAWRKLTRLKPLRSPVFRKFDACCHVRSCVFPRFFSKLNSLRRRRRIFFPASG
ncbi:hypothetical protein, partial [Klebsiella pneumoniae]|uniref:hypothetical protein n=1 Tax=Klebsiella pneumoniae TaxID=573 RepID=UPI003D8073B2